ncbi:hypothetical protein [Inediibacterium massiliense]|uniref:hypothetical protein n=1 Tax=Inediibacterium massiliense TaxID=1658111 RepID=UPI0006B58018|nr:hypothetical protein [Inediibacterium massiliense]
MDKKVLWTTSYEDIIESISNICDCSEQNINNYLKYYEPFNNIFVGDIQLNNFLKIIGVKFNNNTELFEMIKFDKCVISHLTTRTKLPNKSNIYCLTEVLSKTTDLSKFLACKGINFKETSQGLITFFNNKIVDWNSFDGSYAYRIKKRLKARGEYIDNCINGFLFNHLFWEDSNVEHIRDCPEIVSDICYVLNRQDILNEWRKISTLYALGFLVDIKDIIFDEHAKLKTTKSKIYLTYKYVIYYLVQVYHNVWNTRFNNPIIRLKDNQSVIKENIIGFYEIKA